MIVSINWTVHCGIQKRSYQVEGDVFNVEDGNEFNKIDLSGGIDTIADDCLFENNGEKDELPY